MENRTNMNDVEQQIQKYYARQSLSPETLRTMLANAEQVRPSFWMRRWPVLAVAVVVVLLAGGAVYLTCFQQSDVTNLVAEEMATRHTSDSKSEAQAVHYENQYSPRQIPMPPLPSSPQNLPLQQNFDVVRERDFTIYGSPATQVIMQERQSGSTISLYVVPLSEELRHVKPGMITRHGVAVRLWKDHDRLFGLAAENTPLIQPTP
jgi:hypothetical protein